MRTSHLTPIEAVVWGSVAGAAGIVAMDALWYIRHILGGGRSNPLTYEFGGAKDWEKVSAPGKVGKRLIEGFTQEELPEDKAPLVNNLVHWAYGLGWGAAYGIVVGSLRRRPARFGLPFGAAVWLIGYALLPLAKLYKPIWRYDPTTLGQDLAGHLVYGAGTAIAFRLLVGEAPDRR
jgi:hypothetical protein